MFKRNRPQGDEPKNQLPPPPKHSSGFIKRLSLIGLGKEQDYFIEHFAMLVQAGMDLVSALQAIKQGVSTRAMKKIISAMQAEIDAGASLSSAFAETGLFAPHLIALIRTGEEAGTLSENLAVIVEQQHKDRSFKSKLRSASMYPLFVLGLAFVLGIGIAWFILPRLSSVFVGLNVKLPLVTRLLMQLGEFMRLHGAVAVPTILGGLLFIGFFVFSYRKTNFIGQWILFHFPGINQLLQEVELSRFGYIFGTMLKAGITATAALTTLADASVFRRYKKLYQHLRHRIEEGDSFQEAFAAFKHSGKLIPIPIQQMVVAGQQSGRLAQTVLDIGAVFEEKTETTTKNISVVLEPVLLVFVWLGVVAVALSVILPIYSLIGGLSQGGQATEGGQTAAAEETSVIPTEGGEFGAATTSSAASALTSPALGKVTITPFGLPEANVRATPSTKGELVTKLPGGGEFQYLKKEGDWYQIVLSNSSTAWINYRNVRELP